MWTPCDDPIDEVNEETGKMEIHYYCPYEDYGGSDRCRVCCGLGVDE